MQTSISYLKDHLSEILQAVRLGEEVCITSHHEPIAKIIPTTDHNAHLKEDKSLFLQQLNALQTDLKGRKLSLTKTIIDQRRSEQF